MAEPKIVMKVTMRNYAWTELQKAIAEQLQKTPGEYDVISLIDGVARDVSRLSGVNYNKLATYLEERYDESTR